MCDINNTDLDPEAIKIIATPYDVKTFLKLKQWLGGLQKELDSTWAILGEVYGRQTNTNLSNLGINIRRVKSNLDNVSEFSKAVEYVPEKIQFQAANSDLLKLLVSPLYGDRPEIGLRELVQNSVDAVREFHDLVDGDAAIGLLDRWPIDSDVQVEVFLDDGVPTVIEITDRGIGMSATTIKEYFLKAGATYRNSDVWRSEHQDEDGRSRVARTGRFGIGVLAAYLLGEEIEVTTKRYNESSSNGLKFIAKLDDDAINVTRVTCPVGTKIKIKLSKHAASKLKLTNYDIDYGNGGVFAIFRHNFPDVQTKYEGKLLKKPSQMCPMPSDKDRSWRFVKTKDFDIVWDRYSVGKIYVNGFLVDERNHSSDDLCIVNDALPNSNVISVTQPTVSILDTNGFLPINLQRDKIFSPMGFEDDLIKSVIDDIICFYLIRDYWSYPKYSLLNTYWYANDTNKMYPSMVTFNDGITINNPYLLHEAGFSRVIESIGKHHSIKQKYEETKGVSERILLSKLFGSVLENKVLSKTVVSSYIKKVKSYYHENRDYSDYVLGYNETGRVVFMSKSFVSSFLHSSPSKETERAIRKLYDKDKNCYIYVDGNCEPIYFNHSYVSSGETAILCERTFELGTLDFSKWWIGDYKTSKIIYDRWMEVLGTPVIPYDFDKKKDLLAKAENFFGEIIQFNKNELAADIEKEMEKQKKSDKLQPKN